jgi:hypothetical protein
LARIFAAGSSSKESKTHRKICNLSSGHTENWSVPPCRSRIHISGVYVCFTLPSLMLMNVQSIKRARSFYAVSCITSPGGKHRGLAGSVAALINESLLMLSKPYIQVVTGLYRIGMAIVPFSRPNGCDPSYLLRQLIRPRGRRQMRPLLHLR